MSTTNINIRTDKEIKESAEKIFEQLGLNMTTAVNMFLRQTIRSNGIPFNLTLNTPNSDTKEAMFEAERMAKDPNAKKYNNLDELFGEWDKI